VTPAIDVRNLVFRRGNHGILDDMSLCVDPGQVLALLGPSGCGKSTLIRLILGLEVPLSGSIFVHGVEASRDGQLLLRVEQRGVGVVFQDLALWPHLTVCQNLEFGLRASKTDRNIWGARIRRLLESIGLGEKSSRYPGELSGGERQRVAIARTLVLEPNAVLLDEPLANLDVSLKRELIALFRELLRARDTASLYVTHDIREAAAIANRIAVLQEGRVVQAGTLDEIRAAPVSDFVCSLVANLEWNGVATASPEK
jgi:iron(III) transport system ATP-binding protein